MPANGKPNGRFTLPALTPVSFSLTDGTDIPPPPDSPIEERAPAPTPTPTPVPAAQAASSAPTPTPINGNAAPNGNAAFSGSGVYDGRGRTTTTVDHPPLSPASTSRPSSIRRFLSRKSLNTNYTNGNHDNGSNEDILGGGRPDSPSSFMSGRPELAKKKSGSWFSKLGGGGKRTSVVYENPTPVQPVVRQEKKEPPPPKLPELNQLKAKIVDDDGGLGGGEMFRDIRGE
ncbi:hypothetical protein D0Z07_2987 [Hyphodiscus hymeniophilus]|uniref:Uncharacterized protein n=1 Tax=Hyphodiscus hymeniophilus TaxID=353542 RepID=A0A9P6VLB5_9HELO|nr:hypothetical protein D0Z07_2987 [Hyphodiscus hymeniophilus]